MRKATLLTLFITFSLLSVFAQQDNVQTFLKRIENNYASNSTLLLDNGKERGDYNTKSKTVIEKRFFY